MANGPNIDVLVSLADVVALEQELCKHHRRSVRGFSVQIAACDPNAALNAERTLNGNYHASGGTEATALAVLCSGAGLALALGPLGLVGWDILLCGAIGMLMGAGAGRALGLAAARRRMRVALYLLRLSLREAQRSSLPRMRGLGRRHVADLPRLSKMLPPLV